MTALFSKTKTIDGVKKLKKISGSTIMVLEEAEKHGIVWKKIPYTDLFKLSFNNKTEYFHGQAPSKTTEFAYHCCKNKRIANNVLSEAGLSVSKGYLIKHNDKQDYRRRLYKGLNKPLVVKPVDDLRGNNVYLNIQTEDQYLKAISEIKTFNGQKKVDLLVEEMFDGTEYRILATQKKILSVIQRLPANVLGDGESTIQELIDLKNQDPIRLKVQTYKQIVIDEDLIEFLKNQKLTLDSILPKEKRIYLRPLSPSNIDLGGDTIDVTDSIHPSVRKIVKTLMQSIPGLSLAGIDYMTTDIYTQQTADKYRIIEVNASPSLDWNAFPIQGSPRNIAFEFLKIMFPEIG